VSTVRGAVRDAKTEDADGSAINEGMEARREAHPAPRGASRRDPMKLSIRRRRRQGQGMTEYIIIVGLIAILLVTAVTKFKDALAGAFGAAEGKIKTNITDEINKAGGPGG
jgi:Flp pilus assembly pilin Flp